MEDRGWRVEKRVKVEGWSIKVQETCWSNYTRSEENPPLSLSLSSSLSSLSLSYITTRMSVGTYSPMFTFHYLQRTEGRDLPL